MSNEICVMCSDCDFVTFKIMVNGKEASTKYLLTTFSSLSSTKRSKEKWLLIYPELHFNDMTLNKKKLRQKLLLFLVVIFTKMSFDVAYS